MKDPLVLCEEIQELLMTCALDVKRKIAEYRDENPSLSISQAATYLDLSKQTLRRLEKEGKLMPQRSPGNYRHYTRAQLDAYLFGAQTDSPAPAAQPAEETNDEQEFGGDDEGVEV